MMLHGQVEVRVKHVWGKADRGCRVQGWVGHSLVQSNYTVTIEVKKDSKARLVVFVQVLIVSGE
jgi:hypothetical protein